MAVHHILPFVVNLVAGNPIYNILYNKERGVRITGKVELYDWHLRASLFNIKDFDQMSDAKDFLLHLFKSKIMTTSL